MSRVNVRSATVSCAVHPHVQALERDVAYELIPSLQRRNMHAKLAAALEEVRSAAVAEGSRPMPATAVAYHWQRSCASVEIAEWRRTLKVRISANTCWLHMPSDTYIITLLHTDAGLCSALACSRCSRLVRDITDARFQNP